MDIVMEEHMKKLLRREVINCPKRSRRSMNLLILGARIIDNDVFDIVRSLHIFNKIDFLDDNPQNRNILGKWSDLDKYVNEYPIAIVAVGNEDIRIKWTLKLLETGFIIPTLVHPTAFLSDSVQLGMGSIIGPRVTIASGVSIGVGCIVESGSTISRKTIIPDYSYYEIDKIMHY